MGGLITTQMVGRHHHLVDLVSHQKSMGQIQERVPYRDRILLLVLEGFEGRTRWHTLDME